MNETTDLVELNKVKLTTEQKLEIANRFLIWQDSHTISTVLNIPSSLITYWLASEQVQDYIQRAAGNQELQLHLKRLKRAEWLLDPLLNQIESLINNPDFPVEKRKDSHVSLIKDVLLNRLPTSINKIITTAIKISFDTDRSWFQDNNNNQFKNILKWLESWQVILFWELVESVGELVKTNNQYKLDKILNIINET